MHYKSIPGVVYTWPEIAVVGLTEQQVKQSGREYRTGNFPFSANGRARSMGDTTGLEALRSLSASILRDCSRMAIRLPFTVLPILESLPQDASAIRANRVTSARALFIAMGIWISW